MISQADSLEASFSACYCTMDARLGDEYPVTSYG